MKKTLFTAALVCAMTIFGFAASLQAQDSVAGKELIHNGQYSTELLKLVNLDPNKTSTSLTAKLVKVPSVEGKTFGYLYDGKFVSLGNAAESSVELPYDQLIQFGYGVADSENPDFEARTVSLKVSSDPGYYAGYNNDSFYQLDFSEDPFNGYFEIVVGKPLPAPAVTLVVALAAGALLLLYKNRRQHSIHTEQA